MNNTERPSAADRSAPSPDTSRAARSAHSAAEAVYDAELVRRFNAGDEDAFLEIMTRYRERTFVIARSLLRNHADAEEITQDTFIRAHRGLARFRGDSSLATWLHRIAVNLARNRYWYFFRRCRHATLSLDCPLSDDSTATLVDLVAADDPDPARAASAAEFSHIIQACMEKLPARQREILTLRNVLHCPYEKIADSLGITVGTVKSRVARARENVRVLAAEMCPEYSSENGPAAWFETTRRGGSLSQAVA